MIFPIGLFLSVILAFCVSTHMFGSILYAMNIKKNAFLLFALSYIILMLFDLTIPYANGKIVVNLAFVLTFLIALKYLAQKLDWRIFISSIIVCAVYIFIHFAPYISNYIIIMLSSYILPVLTVFFLLFLGNNLKKEIAAISFGYFASEIIMLFFQNSNSLNIGNIVGQNIFLLMLASYCFLFWTKSKIFGLPQNDIC